MILNGAYLVRSGERERFTHALEALRNEHDRDGIVYELTGPWPPYNFVGEDEREEIE
jgi:hypothetical protein